jgi:hypothetical protein
MKLKLRLVVPVAIVVALLPHGGVAAEEAGAGDPWLASYRGTVIDLRDGWGTAQACTTDGATTACYDSEAEMDRAAASWSTAAPASSAAVSLLASCASSLRLYNGLSYGAPVLQLSTRGVAINLATYSFDNATTSYKVGACASVFYDGANGGGSVFPGNTGAGAQAASMVAGWNDRISSVYIS